MSFLDANDLQAALNKEKRAEAAKNRHMKNMELALRANKPLLDAFAAVVKRAVLEQALQCKKSRRDIRIESIHALESDLGDAIEASHAGKFQWSVLSFTSGDGTDYKMDLRNLSRPEYRWFEPLIKAHLRKTDSRVSSVKFAIYGYDTTMVSMTVDFSPSIKA